MKPKFRRRALYRAINAERKRLGHSWRQVAREVGISDMSLHRLQDHGPSIDAYAKMIAWLRVDLDTFFYPQKRR